ncbi:MAG: DUF1080 domain-containing protein [Acidobacteria bacterium]|nr:DUF1080 domain-containing protein [Acidobacteriota bacterium]
MRVKLMIAGLLAAATASVFAQQPQAQFLGRWNLRGVAPDTNLIYWLEVTEKDGKLHGMFLDRSAHATPVASISVQNGELVWQKGAGEGTLDSPVRPCGPIYRAKVEGGKLVGQHELPGPPCAPNPNAGRGRAGGGEAGAAPAAGRAAAAPAAPAPAPAPRTIKWVGTHQPVWPYANANGIHTYGKPVVIVGPGAGQEAWTGFTPDTWQTECVNRWTFTNGTMKNAVPGPGEKPTCNIYTKEKFKDFKVEAELNLDERQNSGFYIRGRYELQLSLGAIGGATAGRQSLGAIYGWKAADFYAGKPAGEWQKLEAIVVGNRISVWFNDVRIHNNAELPAFTGGALDNDELAPGPLMIQGDHSLVTFRKILVTPITKAGA